MGYDTFDQGPNLTGTLRDPQGVGRVKVGRGCVTFYYDALSVSVCRPTLHPLSPSSRDGSPRSLQRCASSRLSQIHGHVCYE